MYKGGPVYSRLGEIVYKVSELVFPLVILVYGILVHNGVIRPNHPFLAIPFYAVMAFWILIGILQVLFPYKSSEGIFGVLARNITYHILAGMCILFTTGFSSALAGCWAVLLISAYVLKDKMGFLYSALIYVFFVVIDIVAFADKNPAIIGNNIFNTVLILGACNMIVSIFQTQKVSQEKMDLLKANEYLQRDRILALINNMTDAILSIDSKGVVRVFNAASLSLFDTNESFKGKHIDDILNLRDQNNNEVSLFKEILTSKKVTKRDDLFFYYNDEESIRLDITYAPISKGYHKDHDSYASDGYILIMRDITKAKSLEEERDELISVTSHELRTPITIAEGTISNVQVMLDHPNATPQMIKDAINTAHDQILFLAHMVNDLSTLSRAERGVSDGKEDINVRDLAHMLHDKYAKDAKSKNLNLNLDLSAKLGCVHVSRLYLEELLQNFITNSLKYTREGSITIAFHQTGNNINFSVKDTGIGLSKPDQIKVFEKFYRSEDYRTRETGGTGLGLYIAAKLAKKMGTKIELTSRLNHGSTFSFTLPVVEASESANKTVD